MKKILLLNEQPSDFFNKEYFDFIISIVNKCNFINCETK